MSEPTKQSSSDTGPQLRFEVQESTDFTIAMLHGQAGVAQEMVLERELAILAAKPAPVLVVDVSDLQFISSVGIAALLKLQQTIRAKGKQMRLSGVRLPISIVVARCKLNHVFKTFENVEQAKAAGV